jgi:hypothetical protein
VDGSRGPRQPGTRMAALLYLLLIRPLGAGARHFGDPLRLKRPDASNWAALEAPDPSLERSRRMT